MKSIMQDDRKPGAFRNIRSGAYASQIAAREGKKKGLRRKLTVQLVASSIVYPEVQVDTEARSPKIRVEEEKTFLDR